MLMQNHDYCYLSEIYSAIQGEGQLVGVRQIFVRFSACDLRCIWCDTPSSLVKTEFCSVEENAGKRDFQKYKNPISLKDLIGYIKNLSPELHHSVSLTGGEPLLQYKFLSNFLIQLKAEISMPVYLETGGHRPDELKKIIKYVDFISMDFKLPSSAKAGNLWEKHKRFLELSTDAKKKTWVKIVLTNETSFEDLTYAIDVVKSNIAPIEVFLQPVTEQNGSKPPSEIELLDVQMKLLGKYPYIKVIPQVHKLINQK